MRSLISELVAAKGWQSTCDAHGADRGAVVERDPFVLLRVVLRCEAQHRLVIVATHWRRTSARARHVLGEDERPAR